MHSIARGGAFRQRSKMVPGHEENSRCLSCATLAGESLIQATLAASPYAICCVSRLLAATPRVSNCSHSLLFVRQSFRALLVKEPISTQGIHQWYASGEGIFGLNGIRPQRSATPTAVGSDLAF